MGCAKKATGTIDMEKICLVNCHKSREYWSLINVNPQFTHGMKSKGILWKCPSFLSTQHSEIGGVFSKMNPASKHPKDPQLPSFPVWECVLRTQRTCQFNPRDAVNQTSQTTKPLILFPKSLFHLAAESHFFFGKPKVIDFPDGSLKSTTNSIAKRTNRVLRQHHICLFTLNIKQIKQLSTYIEVA